VDRSTHPTSRQGNTVNDYEAIEAINTILDQWFKGGVSAPAALMRIARITGMNKISHEEGK
jgi:hypothetical protein